MRPPPPPPFTSSSNASGSAGGSYGQSQGPGGTQTIDAPFSAPTRPKSADSHRHAPYPTTSVNLGGSGSGGGTAGAGVGVGGASGTVSPTSTGGAGYTGLGRRTSAGQAMGNTATSSNIGVGVAPEASSATQVSGMSGGRAGTPPGAAGGVPYMVALSGWPEPVYVDSALRSRTGGARDSFDMGRGDGWTFPNTGFAPGGGANEDGAGRGHGKFADPRLKANVAVMHNRGALEVAPGWGSSGGSSFGSPGLAMGSMGGLPGMSPASPGSFGVGGGGLGGAVGTGVKVPLGNRGDGLLVMRAVPEVYPSPVYSSASPPAISSSSNSAIVSTARPDPQAAHQPKPHRALSSSPDAPTDAFSLRQQRSPASPSRARQPDPALPPTFPSAENDTSTHGSAEGHGIAKHAGMHAHPLARMSMPGMVGVATEVYPRDPDNGILWRNVTNGLAAQRAGGPGSGAGQGERGADEGKDPHGLGHGHGHGYGNDHVASSTAILSAPTPRAGDGWSPTVPWAATPMGFAGGGKSAGSTPKPTPTPTKIKVKFKGHGSNLKDEKDRGGVRGKDKGRNGARGDDGNEESGSGSGSDESTAGAKGRGETRGKGKREEAGLSVSRKREEDGEMDIDE